MLAARLSQHCKDLLQSPDSSPYFSPLLPILNLCSLWDTFPLASLFYRYRHFHHVLLGSWFFSWSSFSWLLGSSNPPPPLMNLFYPLYIPIAASPPFPPFSPLISSPPLSTTLPFLLSKWEASHWYQSTLAYQVAVKLGKFLLLKLTSQPNYGKGIQEQASKSKTATTPAGRGPTWRFCCISECFSLNNWWVLFGIYYGLTKNSFVHKAPMKQMDILPKHVIKWFFKPF